MNLGTPSLTAAQVEDFRRDGWCLLAQGFDAREVALLDHWARELLALPEEPGKHWVYHEPSKLDPASSLVNRIEYISPFHPGFAELSEVLRATAGQLFGEEAVLFKEKINFKMAGGDGFKAHQDSQAGWDRYASYFVTAMVCIDEATVENGCLEIASGHHRRGLYREWEPLTEEDMADMSFVACPTKPGDVLFFDCYTPHASQPNLTDRTRRIYFATYNRLSEGDHLARYYADKRKSYPPDIEREPGKQYVFRV